MNLKSRRFKININFKVVTYHKVYKFRFISIVMEIRTENSKQFHVYNISKSIEILWDMGWIYTQAKIDLHNLGCKCILSSHKRLSERISEHINYYTPNRYNDLCIILKSIHDDKEERDYNLTSKCEIFITDYSERPIGIMKKVMTKFDKKNQEKRKNLEAEVREALKIILSPPQK